MDSDAVVASLVVTWEDEIKHGSSSSMADKRHRRERFQAGQA